MNVVEIFHTLPHRPTLHRRLEAVDGKHSAFFLKGRQHRLKARNLGGRCDPLGIGIGRCRTDVQDIRTLVHQFQAMRQRGAGAQELAAVGKGIFGDVEDAEYLHDQKERAAEKPPLLTHCRSR